MEWRLGAIVFVLTLCWVDQPNGSGLVHDSRLTLMHRAPWGAWIQGLGSGSG